MHQQLQAWFKQLDALLWQHQRYWQLSPMQCQQFPWPEHTELAALLADFQLDDCEAIDQNPALAQQHFARFWPALWQLPQPELLQPTPAASPFWLATDIAGRKWQQIQYFAATVGQAKLPVLEWCAGKGHLGRLLAHQFGCAVHSVEWQAELCQQGEHSARRLSLPQRFSQRDVLKDDCRDLFQPAQQVLALHACGDLHRVALQEASAAGCQQVHVLPCCYHLQQAALYQPLSVAARSSRLQLTKAQLKLAVQGHATGGARISRLRQTEVWWRRAYQLWRAELTGEPHYQPLPSVGKHWFSGAFIEFARWAAAQHQLTLPLADDGEQYLQQAEALLLLQRRIELVQHVFRRPLELWLVLDRALYLAEQGYQVSVRQLCETQITPRNLLLSGWRAEQH
jgi:hypothetical protein